ncbi:hypothetical protein AHAS_Ahas12G0180600 [Arachis hypogaea]
MGFKKSRNGFLISKMLYMADDLLDELSTKADAATPTQRDLGNYSSMYHSIVDSILEDSDDDDYEMGVVDLVDKLESIVKEQNGLRLKGEPVKDLEDMSWRIELSLVESFEIFGRDSDKEAIVDDLVS